MLVLVSVNILKLNYQNYKRITNFVNYLNLE